MADEVHIRAQRSSSFVERTVPDDDRSTVFAMHGRRPSVPPLAAQLHATATDATHIAVTRTITVNGATMRSQSTTVTIAKS